MKNIKSFTLILSLAAIASTWSCSPLHRAERAQESLQFNKAIGRYQSALKKDSTNTLAWAGLGECYRMNNLNIEAEKCFAKAVTNPKIESPVKLHYAQVLISNMNYEEARKWITIYKAEVPGDSRGIAAQASLDKLDELHKDENKYKVEKLPFNSGESDFSPALYRDGIVFTSSRKGPDFAQRNDNWTGQNYYSLYFAKGDASDYEAPVLFEKSNQNKLNNSSVCFNHEGTEMFLTQNNVENGKVRHDDERQVRLKIYSAKLVDDKWSELTPFYYNSNDYSCAHPALSPDGDRLYFSSDMPGTFGGMDLWMSTRTNEGWSAPVNLGIEINSEGNELFPTVDKNGTLYFSSNGRGGLGGLDIFIAEDPQRALLKCINLGAPVNSSDDDFGLVWNPGHDIGYFSSNRTQQGMNDDIFAVSKNDVVITMAGIVLNEITQLPVDSARITLINLTTKDTIRTFTDAMGKYSFKELKSDCNYRLVAANDLCIGKSLDTTTVGIKSSVAMEIPLQIACLNQNIVLNNIYYDLDKSNIRPDAAEVLDKIAALLITYPKIEIELGSHTDSRASFQYNMELSERRAKSAVKYLVAHGIERKRMTYRGYGESKLVNNCTGEGRFHVECSETEHQLNRRTEIKVLTWDKVATRK